MIYYKSSKERNQKKRALKKVKKVVDSRRPIWYTYLVERKR
jgi:hypothetical protein